MKNTRRIKVTTFVRKGGPMTRGIPENLKGKLAYLNAYEQFLEEMSKDVRFVLVDEWMRLTSGEALGYYGD